MTQSEIFVFHFYFKTFRLSKSNACLHNDFIILTQTLYMYYVHSSSKHLHHHCFRNQESYNNIQNKQQVVKECTHKLKKT